MMWLVTAGVCLGAIAAGFFLPVILAPGENRSVPQAGSKEHAPALIPFGEVLLVNLSDAQQTRFLRVKLFLVAPGSEEKTVAEALQQKKVFLKDWLISYLSDQTEAGVRGAAGKNRVRREVRERFNAMLFPDGPDRVTDVLFEEFNVQ